MTEQQSTRYVCKICTCAQVEHTSARMLSIICWQPPYGTDKKRNSIQSISFKSVYLGGRCTTNDAGFRGISKNKRII
jgi:hypothetical protein